MRIKTNEICLYGFLGVLIFILKLAMSPLPNIEPVSFLVIIYTIVFGIKTIYPLTIYVILEIAFYGFGIWSIGYLYIWLILMIVTLSIYNIRHSTNTALWATVSGIYGLITGLLYIPLYIILGDINLAISWWASGIIYDIIHGVSNFIVCIILFKPITQLMFTLNKQYKINRRT